MDPKLLQQIIEAIKAGDGDAALKLLEQLLAGGGEGGSEGASDPSAGGGDPAAAQSAMAAVRELSAQVKDMRDREAKIEQERAAADSVERKRLIARLVKMGVETPATAWEGEPEKQTPCKRLTGEPVSEMRARVEALAKTRPEVAAPPASGHASRASRYAIAHAELTPAQKAKRDQNAQATFARSQLRAGSDQ